MNVEQAEALVAALRDAIAQARRDGYDTIDLQESLSSALGTALDELEAAIAGARGA
jgi:predicted trehalose synthase